MVYSVSINQVSGDNFINNVLLQFLADFLIVDCRGVLLRDKNGVDTDWLNKNTFLKILNCDLNLCIWSHPRANILSANCVESLNELVAEHMSEGHKLFSLISSISNHETLISSTNIFVFLANMNSFSYFS